MTPSLLKVREALEPFAKLGADYNRSEASTARKYADEGRTYTPHSDYHRVSVAIGDLRRAAAAYESLSHLEATTPQPLDGVTVPQWALDWLFGAGPDKSGRHFDRNDYPDARGAYWWRSQFRKMIALSNPKPEE